MEKKKLLLLLFIIVPALFLNAQVDYTGYHWKPDFSLYETNMTMTGIVKIDGVQQATSEIEIAAFCGEEVRDSHKLKYEAGNDTYYAYLTICGNDDDVISFRIYDHRIPQELDLTTDEITFETNLHIGDNNDPYIFKFRPKAYTFTGSGAWNAVSNWSNGSLPLADNDVIIDGDAVITGENGKIEINSLLINEGKSLTIEDGGFLEVAGLVQNTNADALIINDGGQIYQTNDNVAATFNMEIVKPSGTWGEDDNTGWQFIASPMQNSSFEDFIPEDGDYDLYGYDGTLEQQWYNYKNNKVEYTFDDINDFSTIDDDNDGHNWYFEDGLACSDSFDDEDGELTPDNYLVFPKIKVEEGTVLSLELRAFDDAWPEYCGIAYSENGEDFQMIDNASWTIGSGDENNMENPSDWYYKEIALSAHAGKEIYLAIRHYYNETIGWTLQVQNVNITLKSGNFQNAVAYLASYEKEQIADFKGKLNKEESYTIKASYSSDNQLKKYNLFANPFTYDIDWTTDVNPSYVEPFYAILKADGTYEYKEDGTIKVGDGFMVCSKSTRAQLKFQKNINSTAKSMERNSLNITASSLSGSDNIIINFDEDHSAFPKLENFNENISNIYLKNNDTVYSILNYSEDVEEILIYFDAKEIGNYTLHFDVKGNLGNMYLLDKMTGNEINLSTEKEYSFVAASTEEKQRFVLRKISGDNTDIEEVFAYVSDGELKISGIDGNCEINIYDLLGRNTIYTNTTGNCDIYSISIDNFKKGVYIIRLVDDNGLKTQKIIF